MLIVPISGKIGLKHPPVITVALVAINVLIFFMLQMNDDEARMAAEQFYLASGLAEIEVPHYVSYRRAAGDPLNSDQPIDAMDADERMAIHFQMEADAAFLKRLAADQVILPQDPDHAHWKELRQAYEQKRSRSVAFSYGLRPAYPTASAFITYMFLHGGVGHLMGNMAFLWILGCMLEIGAGRLFFSGLYLLSGLLAAGLFYLVYPHSTIPLVGASGAIAGLMGAYTILYGKKKVSIFYSLGFYFNTATIPAISLLPAWIANECYQLFFSGASQVAYVAHIGGLVAGALLAFAGQRVVGTVDRDRFEEAPEDKLSPLIAEALEHMGRLEMRQAQELFEQVLEMEPDHRETLTHLFNIHKLNPESERFHTAAKRLLGVLLGDVQTHPAALAHYTTYADLVGRPALSIPMYLQIAGLMAGTGKVDSAEKIVLAVLKRKPDSPGLPASLIKVAHALRKNGQTDRWQRYRSLICKCYPESVEAVIISRADASG